jgi:serine/threonine protein kinase
MESAKTRQAETLWPPTGKTILDGMTMIAARYHLLRKLASGGMAEVWLAEQKGPGDFARRLVIKTIHPHLAEDHSLVTAFADEARLAGLLHHPHIVRVEDFGEENGRPYLVMEYLEGHNLKQLATLANGLDTKLPERLVLQLGIQVAEALGYAHQLRDEHGDHLAVVHRDVSPQNIMLTPNGSSKLVDFGIARATSNQGQTRTGTLKGKLAYLSPEQASGKKELDHRADQFSLGVVLWELLVGSRLFASDSDVGTLQRVAFGDIPSLALYGRRFPRPLIQAIDRSLKRDRDQRFPDCRAFAEALRICLSELGGNFSPSDYHAWLARIAGGLSVPKPLPILSEEAVQRTESVPALAAHGYGLNAHLVQAATDNDAADRTAHQMPLTEEPTQITHALPDMDSDQPTRVSLRVVGTATHPRIASATTPVHEAIEPRTDQNRLLLSALIFGLAGVGVYFVLGQSTQKQRTEQAQEKPATTRQSAPHERADQLARADFLKVVESHKAATGRCLSRHGKPGVAPVVEMGIRSNGKPTSAHVSNAPNALAKCIKRVVVKWRFPAFRGPAITHRFHVKP